MMRQDQTVDAGGTAMQAGRDLVVHQGISAEQMTAIMVAMGKQLAVFADEARKIADERIEAFRDSILRRFAEPGRANPEAFKEPDFQYLLADAQEAVARSGDEAVRETLVDLIARRSLEKDRNRLALTLSDAATRAANLTAEEFAALSLIYLVRHTIRTDISNLDKFCNYVTRNFLPFANLVSRENSSYLHIQAQSCGSIEISQVSIEEIWRRSYPGVLGRGFTREQLEAHLPDGKKNALDPLIITCLNDPTKLQPNAISLDVLKQVTGQTGLTEAEIQNVWNLFESTITDIGDLLRSKVPEIDLLFDVWKTTPLKQLMLTSTGIAIGHANASRMVGFDAGLDIWIK